MNTEHLSYYVNVYHEMVGAQYEVDYLQYGTFEEMLNYLDECKQEYGFGYLAVVTIFKDIQVIDRETIQF